MKQYLTTLIAIAMIFLCACSASPSKEPDAPSVATPSENAEITEVPQEEPDQPMPDGAKLTNILLLGSMDNDFSKQEGYPFSLTHILVTLDPENQVVKFTTFPYNLGVDVDNDEAVTTQQLQFVCAAQGQEATVRVLEQNFDIDIDYWVSMNMRGVIDIVDALEGIEIDILSLSLNEMAVYMVDMLELTWEEVTSTGPQTLSGVQTAGYFVDTKPEDEDNWMEEEELLFRDRHENIINALIQSVQVLNLEANDLLDIAENVQDHFDTNIEKAEWLRIAQTAIYCLQNDAQYLHIPQDISIIEIESDMPMNNAIGYDKASDVEAAKKFVNSSDG